MTRLINILFLILLIIGCKRETENISTPSCNASQNYEKEPDEAARKILGTWRLVKIGANTPTPPAVPNQLVTFKADGTCVVTRDGTVYPPYPFLVGVGKLPGSQISLPQLVVKDSTQGDMLFRELGKSILFVCDEEMILDYGTPVDLPSAIYRRENL